MERRPQKLLWSVTIGREGCAKPRKIKTTTIKRMNYTHSPQDCSIVDFLKQIKSPLQSDLLSLAVFSGFSNLIRGCKITAYEERKERPLQLHDLVCDEDFPKQGGKRHFLWGDGN